MDNYYVSKLIPLIAEAGVAAIANPLINITIQGRHDTYPKRRGMTRVPELMAAGIDVALGHDCVLDPWYPLGSADMLEVAHMGVHVAQMTGQQAMAACFDAVTTVPAKILGLEGYGLAPGCHADFVLLEARDPVEAIRLKATRLAVVRRGRIIARTPSAAATLDLPGRPATTRYRTGRECRSRLPPRGRCMSLSVIVIAKDEEASIARTLRSVAFADEIVVVDSGSTRSHRRHRARARREGHRDGGLAGVRPAEESRARSRHRRLGALARCRRVADRRSRPRRYGVPSLRTRPTSPPIGCRAARASADAFCATRAGGRTTSCGCFAAAAPAFRTTPSTSG